jgi:hypothetical protein
LSETEVNVHEIVTAVGGHSPCIVFDISELSREHNRAIENQFLSQCETYISREGLRVILITSTILISQLFLADVYATYDPRHVLVINL